MNHHIVLRVVAKLLIPSILLFALYTQFHGDYGPGGGFQAGVIYTAAFILHTLVFGLENTKKIISPKLVQVLSAVGVMLYASVGFASIFLGGNFLEYGALIPSTLAHAANPAGQHLGILLVELGVGITVSSVILTIFYNFAAKDNDDIEADDEANEKGKLK